MSLLPPTRFSTGWRHPRVRDATGGTGRGGGAAGAARKGRARAPRAPGSARQAGPSCHLAASEGGGAELEEEGARAPLALSGGVFSASLHLRPFRLPPLTLALSPQLRRHLGLT